MPGASRKGIDVAGGVGIEGSDNVFVNGANFMRHGDRVEGHGKSPHSPPPPMIASCNEVYVNGILSVHQGNQATCGHTISGSGDVFTGD